MSRKCAGTSNREKRLIAALLLVLLLLLLLSKRIERRPTRRSPSLLRDQSPRIGTTIPELTIISKRIHTVLPRGEQIREMGVLLICLSGAALAAATGRRRCGRLWGSWSQFVVRKVGACIVILVCRTEIEVDGVGARAGAWRGCVAWHGWGRTEGSKWVVRAAFMVT